MEQQLNGADLGNVGDRDGGMTEELLEAALLVRQHAGRINDLIHAMMIVRALPKILEPGERIARRPSLASGNDPSRKFDLETDRRVAEFKAAGWKGRDTMRKRMLVADLAGWFLGVGSSERSCTSSARCRSISCAPVTRLWSGRSGAPRPTFGAPTNSASGAPR